MIKWAPKRNDRQLVKYMMKKYKLGNLQANLLLNRNIKDPKDIEKYLHGNLDDLYDVMLLKDSEKALRIIEKHIAENMKIMVFGDYDADGITSIGVSTSILRKIGANVDFYIPHRVYEGYGMNDNAIRKIAKDGYDLIITVDNGISSMGEIKLAKELGMTVVVTDHHDIPAELPPADAIVNPKQPDCKHPNKKLCGCSVIWKLLYELCKRRGNEEHIQYALDTLSLVAIGTIADLMDLEDENRIIVKEGLKRINEQKNLGITQLKKALKIANVKAENIGFAIGPCLNADGRLDDAKKAVELILTEDEQTAAKLSEYLISVNSKRKEITKQYFDKADQYIVENNLEDSLVMVVFIKDIPEGIVGLIASRVKEKYQVPTLVFTEGETHYKASGRGVEGHPLGLFDALQQTKKYWDKGGGHKMACGLSVKKDLDNLNAFAKKLNEITAKLLEKEPFEQIFYYETEVNNPDYAMCMQIDEVLEPTGKGNPKPLMLAKGVDVIKHKEIGDGTHLSFEFNSGRSGLAFGKKYLYDEMDNPMKLDLLYSPAIDTFGRRNGSGIKMMIETMRETRDYKNKKMLISSFKNAI